MNFIKTIIKKIFPRELPKPMGRWRMENNNAQMNQKIDLSNEDHCGPCGQYALSKMDFSSFPMKKVSREKRFIKKI